MAKIDYVLGYIDGVVDIITEGNGFEPEKGVSYRITEDFITVKKVWYYIPAVRSSYENPPQDDEPVYTYETVRLDNNKWKKEIVKLLEDIYNSDIPDNEVPEFED